MASSSTTQASSSFASIQAKVKDDIESAGLSTSQIQTPLWDGRSVTTDMSLLDVNQMKDMLPSACRSFLCWPIFVKFCKRCFLC